MRTDKLGADRIVPLSSTGLVLGAEASLAARGRSDLVARAEAVRCWVRGRKLLAEGQYAEAIVYFERGFKLRFQDAVSQWRQTFTQDLDIRRHEDNLGNSCASLNFYQIEGGALGIATQWTVEGLAVTYVCWLPLA